MRQIADLFFVHHRGGANGLYMTMVMIGVSSVPPNSISQVAETCYYPRVS